MEILAGEKFYKLIDFVFKEPEHILFAGAHDNVFHSPDDARCDAVALARKVGIGGNGCKLVARHLQFGYDLYMPLFGIGHHIADFVLRIESAIGGAVAFGAERA